MAVLSELEKLGIKPLLVELGEIELADQISDNEKSMLSTRLQLLGFELIDDKKSQIIERIKTLIIDLVHNRDNDLKTNLSVFIAADLGQDYSALSNLFSEVEGTTIEQYFISQKIERVKELLMYNELSLSEIAWQLNYSSVAHLSKQFKKITGLTPTFYKQLKDRKRRQIDDL
ncbi:hypothetical protein FNO01nite_33670 [Flavobacterium noncentrifugens]|nr:hypothetical protein FNO01nite_33670 [Flavobacterium noncentrifugens]